MLWTLAEDPHGRAWLAGGVHGIVASVPWDEGGSVETLRNATRLWSPGAVVGLSPDGDVMIVALESDVELWQDGAVAARTQHPTGIPIMSFAFDPGGSRVVTTGTGVTLWQVPSLEVVGFWADAKVAAFSPDGTVLALGDRSGAIRLVHAPSLAFIGPPLRGHDDAVIRLAFTPDGRHLVSIDAHGGVWRWSTDPDDWLALACALAWRDLEAAEIGPVLPSDAFEPVCGAPGA